MASVYRVQPWAGGWSVFSGEQNLSTEPLRTAADAVAHAKELARGSRDGAHISVYDESGALKSEFFFQPEERHALDRDDTIPSIAASAPVRRRGRPGA